MVWRPNYVTRDDEKAYLGIDLDDESRDTEIDDAIAAASAAINTKTFRQFGKSDTVVTRRYKAEWDRHRDTPAWVVVIDDVYDAAGLVVNVNGVAITDYTLEDQNALVDGKVYTDLVIGPNAAQRPTRTNRTVELVTDKWGWPAFPAAVVAACKLQAGRFSKRPTSLFGVAGSPATGSELRLLDKLDPDVVVMLRGLFRVRT